MALELVSSAFRRSFTPPALEVECEWEYNGKTIRTLSLADPYFLTSLEWWSRLQVTIGTKAMRLKTGEVVVVADDTPKS